MPAYVSAKSSILQYIKENKLKPGDRLPSEAEFSELLGIGRLTLREAMKILKSEGIIHSVQGKGTFVTCNTEHISDFLNNNLGVTEMIEASGFKPGVAFFEKELIKADDVIAEQLKIKSGIDILMCARVRLADDTPVVYSQDYLSPRLAQDFLSITDNNISLYNFIEETCKIELGFCMTEIVPVCADEKLAKLLKINKGMPLMKIKATVNDAFGEPLIYAIEYFRPDKFKFIINRGR